MRCEWGYWCYCDPSNCIKSMCSQVDITYDGTAILYRYIKCFCLVIYYICSHAELESLAPQCMHIKAVMALFEAFDNEHELTPNDFLNGNVIIRCLYVI